MGVRLLTALFFSLSWMWVGASWGETKTFRLTELSFEHKFVLDGGRDPMFPPSNRPVREMNLRMDFDLFESFYMRNQVWSVMDSVQFRGVGWHYYLGARVLPFMDVRMEHFSKHLLDMPGTSGFPVEDSFSVIFYLWGVDNSGRSLMRFNPFGGL